MRQLDWAAVTAGVSGGKMPVIFTPMGAASALVAPLMTGFNGKTVLEKASPLAGKTGQKLMDEKFSLYDDATLPLRPTSRPFDDEGVASRRLPLVESGMVKGFYYDLKTAALAGVASTGHVSAPPASLRPHPPPLSSPRARLPLTTCWPILKRGWSLSSSWRHSGNILGGDFSGNVLLGYKVEHGKIAGRVKDTVVFGNVYDLLKEIAALAAMAAGWAGLFTPSIYFPALSVASKGLKNPKKN
jgi:PmbA protein